MQMAGAADGGLMTLANELSIWWMSLSAASLINTAAWFVSAWLLGKRRARWPADAYTTRRKIMWLAAAYVLGCGFRSVLPMIEVPHICLFDVWISRVAVTRSVATIAEICFAAQWALLLREAGADTGTRLATLVSRILVPIVILAELFCWYAVFTGSYLPHAIENAHWTLAGMLVVMAFIALWPRVGNGARPFVAAVIASGTVYVAFMIAVDVPMYLARWQDGIAAGHEARSLIEGLRASLQRCVVTNDWAIWREDAVWLSLYFTAGVWVSIALAHAPHFRRDAGSGR
jgi:hypothetical protein